MQRQVITSLIALALVAVGCVGAASSEVRDRIDDLGIDPSSSLLYDRRSGEFDRILANPAGWHELTGSPWRPEPR